MKLISFTKRDYDGNFVISPKHFIWLNLTGGIGLALLFMLALTFHYNGGSYLPGVDMIHFFGKDYSPEELHYIANHEIGHHVWFTVLTEEERQQYREIFESSDIYVTEYSKTKVEENFAEEYAFYMSTWGHPSYVSEDRTKFFTEIVENEYAVYYD